jgi:hypothetical protein
MTQRKASLFFTTDTLIAVIVIVGAFMLVQSSYSTQGQGEDPQQVLVEINRFFTQTTVGDLLEEYPGVYEPPNFDAQSDAWRRELSIYQELNYLDNNGYESEAEQLLRRLSELTVSDRFSYRYTVNDDVFHERVNTPISETPAYVTKRSLIYSPTDDGSRIIGPNKTMIALWL